MRQNQDIQADGGREGRAAKAGACLRDDVSRIRMGGSKLLVDFEKDKSKTWGARALRAGIETPSP